MNRLAPLTREQIWALAPDASANIAAGQLATRAKWVRLGRSADGRCAWGECKGSGAKPYQTQVDFAGPAFKCSCPSRKLPCKHGLALALMLDADAAAIAAEEPPGWVTTWLADRDKRAAAKAAPAAPTESATSAEPADPGAAAARAAREEKARARRVATREARVAAGVDELRVWLRDLVRGGLATAGTQAYGYWEKTAARLVDHQAPGLARAVRELGAVPGSGDGWQGRLLERAARLHLALEAHGRLDALPAATRADVRTTVGYPVGEEELASEPGVSDTWIVVGQRTEEEERLRARRSWLYGAATGRVALLLHFAFGSAPFADALATGIALRAELVYYPSAVPLRATLRARSDGEVPSVGSVAALLAGAGHDDVASALAGLTAARARQPWLERVPVMLRAVTPELVGDPAAARWRVRDESGAALPVDPRFAGGWPLVAASGGRPLWLFGEWDGDAILPLSWLADGALLTPAEG